MEKPVGVESRDVSASACRHHDGERGFCQFAVFKSNEFVNLFFSHDLSRFDYLSVSGIASSFICKINDFNCNVQYFIQCLTCCLRDSQTRKSPFLDWEPARLRGLEDSCCLRGRRTCYPNVGSHRTEIVVLPRISPATAHRGQWS